MIIIEGPDAAGKTTLAHHLADVLATSVYAGEGPPRYVGDIPDRLARYAALPHHVICDRHPCVSEAIYSEALRRQTELTPDDIAHFYYESHLLIYCDPLPTTPHTIKAHDTREHLEASLTNRTRLLTLYREWALQRAHVVYRIGDDVDRIVHFAHSYTDDISDFHHRFALGYFGTPRQLPHDLWQFRLRFMLEELCEYAGVSDLTKQLVQSAILEHASQPPLTDQFDALIDLVYVALGTSYLHGFPFQQGWSRVHRANMKKVRASTANDSKRGHSADVVKPLGWCPPSLDSLIEGGLSFSSPPALDGNPAGGTREV